MNDTSDFIQLSMYGRWTSTYEAFRARLQDHPDCSALYIYPFDGSDNMERILFPRFKFIESGYYKNSLRNPFLRYNKVNFSMRRIQC